MAAFRKVASFAEYFPLRNPSEEMVGQLYQCLWAWQDCVTCINSGLCTSETCRWVSRPSLASFGAFYKKITFRYTSDDWCSSSPLLQNHRDLQQLIRFIVDRPERPREELMSEYFCHTGDAQALLSDKDRAMNLAYSVIAMLPCAEWNQYYVHYRVIPPVIWKKSQAACEVWENAMPTRKTLTREEAQYIVTSLSAKRLQDCGFKIVDTTDPRLHLVHESTVAARRVYVFHQEEFLKEHLAYQVRHGSATKHVIPRQVALELLHTLRHVLYKWDDGASRQMAIEAGFRVGSLSLDTSDYSYDDEHEVQFHYWGTRLLALTKTVNAPGAGYWIWRQFFGLRRYRTEHMMLILAFLAFLVTVVSSVIGPWMQSQEKEADPVRTIDHNSNSTRSIG
ncbi:hypothetical protein SVAN01_03611 [Stagonosporopsis vannaccii]|nr:hypothetical protein SVAN01_03611 [Stagonosporopsis vannaccii]